MSFTATSKRSANFAVPILAAILFGNFSYSQTSASILYYRLSTSLSALYFLYNLRQDQVQAFLNSYRLFDQEVAAAGSNETIVQYYQVMNQLCAVGEVEKMYVPPVVNKMRGIHTNQMLWEEAGLADKLHLGPGKKVLDLGCGRGRIAHHVASYSGAQVVGINIDKSQISMARGFAKATGMGEDRLQFVVGDYNEPLPFANETFDAVYHVLALTYAQDLRKLFTEIMRVLKPGGKISFLDWFQLDNYNPEDPHHRKLLNDVKQVIGAVHTPTPRMYQDILNKTGLEVVSSADASVDGGHQWPLVVEANNFYLTMATAVGLLTSLGVLPGHMKTLLQRLIQGVDSWVEGDKLGLFTTSWQIIAQKPFP